MYAYKYGAIGEAIRTKIDGFKQQVKGGERTDTSFADVLKSQLGRKTETKVVSATGNNTPDSETMPALSGSTLLYAIRNSNDDTTASAVLSSLGFNNVSSTGNDLKAAADNLSATAEQLIKANGAGGYDTALTAEFAADFNKLMTQLSIESGSSAYLYKNALSAMLNSSAEELKKAGLTAENGLITYTGGNGQLPDLFLSNAASAAAMVSSYADTIISGSETGISEYYTALMNNMV